MGLVHLYAFFFSVILKISLGVDSIMISLYEEETEF